MSSAVEEPVFFRTEDGIDIQGALFSGSDKAALIAHPHPLYGGDMENLVVQEIAAIYQARRWTTLRFNFRGTGKSGGSHGRGAGEQHDIRAAAAYLKAQDAVHIDITGYSFGAWVIAHTDLDRVEDGRILMIAPPAAMMDFSGAPPCSRLKLAVTGSEDAIAPPGVVRRVLARLNPEAELRVIKGADHFFSNRLTALKAVVDEFLHL